MLGIDEEVVLMVVVDENKSGHFYTISYILWIGNLPINQQRNLPSPTSHKWSPICPHERGL